MKRPSFVLLLLLHVLLLLSSAPRSQRSPYSSYLPLSPSLPFPPGLLTEEFPSSPYSLYLPLSPSPSLPFPPGLLTEEFPITLLSPSHPYECSNPTPHSEKYFQKCNKKPCDGNAVNSSPTIISFPKRIKQGMETREMIQRVLNRAWGENPPRIDLYVRAGCYGAKELRYLFQTVELFWPEKLGQILVVLDAGDETVLPWLVGNDTRLSYRVIYEDCPCLDGGVFNQLSYMTLDQHTKAEFVMTIDSDCGFFRPVTPDVLFNAKGLLVLPSSREIEKGPQENWLSSLEYYTKLSALPYGHSMITQPVSVVVASLPAFRGFIKKQFGMCYHHLVAQGVFEKKRHGFAWMSQLSTFLAHTNYPKYEYRIVEESAVPYLRSSVHANYESIEKPKSGEREEINRVYGLTLNAVVNQGLCFWFGEEYFPTCKGQSTAFVEKLLLNYQRHDLSPAVPKEEKWKHVREAQQRVLKTVALVLQ